MIGRIRHGQFIGLGSFQAFLGLDTQVQLQLAINPINALVVPFEALHVAQIQKAQAKSPRPPIGGQTHQPIRDHGVLIAQLAVITVAGLADLERTAGQRDADTASLGNPPEN